MMYLFYMYFEDNFLMCGVDVLFYEMSYGEFFFVLLES